MRIKGILRRENGNWFVETQDTILPLHPKENVDGLGVGQRITFIVETIGVGGSEYDVMDCDTAKSLMIYNV